MTIPVKKVRVGPFDYTIEKLAGKEAEGSLGLCSPEKQAIYLRDKYSTASQEAETLLHETLHAIFAVSELEPKKDSEERIVSCLSVGLASAIRDNQTLFRWFLTRFK